MKQKGNLQSDQPEPARSGDRVSDTVYLKRVHPVPQAASQVLRVALHLIHQCAAAQGKVPPDLSEDAARFLTSRSWRIEELAFRTARAVSANRGSLITAADLCEF
jgi:DNA-binding NtrC family response regulator